MSQNVWTTINPAATSGTQLATLLDNFKEAVMSGMSGTSRPTETDAGGMWVDTTNEGSPNFYWSAKIYTGTVDIEVFRINLATSKVSINTADSTFEISRYTEDTVGPIAKLIKRRVTANGGLVNGDIIGTMQFIGRGTDSTNPVVAYMECVATDDFDGTKSGGYLRWFTTVALGTTAIEHMRLVDGKLGVGTQAPTASVHAKGSTGILSERIEDTVNGAILKTQKRRATGTGAAQTSDVLQDVDAYTRDSSSNDVVGARIRVTATEGHTATNRGTKVSIQSTTIGEATPTSKLEIGDKVESLGILKVNSEEFVSQDVATAATIAQLSATKRLVEMTGATTTDIQGINSGHASKNVLIHNRSTAYVTLKHQDAGAAAADRMKLPNGAQISIPPDGSVDLFYCVTDTRWKVASSAGGSGGGGGTALTFFEGGNSPIKTFETELEVYEYSPGLSQELFTVVRVPTSYIQGLPIALKILWTCASTSGDAKIDAVATLIRSEVDDVTSTTNQRTTTNAAITMTASNDLEPQKVTLDITSTTGQINAVSVSAGDMIKVKIKENGSTTADTVKLIPSACEVTFS